MVFTFASLRRLQYSALSASFIPLVLTWTCEKPTSFEEKIGLISKIEDIKGVDLYGDWDVITTSDTYTKKDSRTIEYKISVPADGTKTVSYTVEYTY